MNSIIQAAIGGWHCLAVDDHGRAYAWGGNEYGQCNEEPERKDEGRGFKKRYCDTSTICSTTHCSPALTYFQLAAEDHQWWWRSFLCGGSTGYLFMDTACITIMLDQTCQASCRLLSSLVTWPACAMGLWVSVPLCSLYVTYTSLSSVSRKNISHHIKYAFSFMGFYELLE